MSEGPLRTLAVSLWDGQRRATLPNTATVMRPVHAPRQIADARELFAGAYARFAPACRAIEEPGLALVAIDETTGHAAGLARLVARVGRPVTALVGRHDRCDLYLAARPELALRQLAVVLEPVTSWARGATTVRYRIADLRTHAPMVDETGRALEGLLAEGPAIVRCAGYVLYALPLGDPSDWPERADDAWAMLPDRVYLDHMERCAEGSLPALRVPRAGARETYITRTGGPRVLDDRLARGAAAGSLYLQTPRSEITLDVGERALHDGVLLGRYDRCAGTAVLAHDESLSRVHALLVRQGDRLLLVDTASSNGTFADLAPGADPVRVIEVQPGATVRLGKATFMAWTWTA